MVLVAQKSWIHIASIQSVYKIYIKKTYFTKAGLKPTFQSFKCFQVTNIPIIFSHQSWIHIDQWQSVSKILVENMHV